MSFCPLCIHTPRLLNPVLMKPYNPYREELSKQRSQFNHGSRIRDWRPTGLLILPLPLPQPWANRTFTFLKICLFMNEIASCVFFLIELKKITICHCWNTADYLPFRGFCVYKSQIHACSYIGLTRATQKTFMELQIFCCSVLKVLFTSQRQFGDASFECTAQAWLIQKGATSQVEDL